MFFEHGGVKLYYERHGESGKPLLLLHGWGGKCDSFLPVIRDFKAGHQVVVLDFPGHGLSSEPPVPWSVSDYMEMVRALIEHLGISRADIIGHSHGGRVAIALAAEHPELVGRMVLTSAAGLKPRPTRRGRLQSRAYRLLKAVLTSRFSRAVLGEARVQALQERLIQRFGSSDYRALTPGMRLTFNRLITQDLEPQLNRIQSPTLLIWGENDTATPIWMAKRMEQKIADVGLVVFPGCGHFAYLDRYPDFRAIVDKFLS